MAITQTPIQQTTASGGSSTNQIIFTLTSVPGLNNALILTEGGADITNGVITGVVQTGVTWTKIISSNTNVTNNVWYGLVTTAGASLTITATYSNTIVTITRGNVAEFGGISLTGTVDTSSAATGNSATPTTATITPKSGVNLLIIAVTRRSGTFTSGPDTNGFTALTTPNTGFQPAYKFVSNSSGTYNTQWTFTAGAVWDALIAAINVYPFNVLNNYSFVKVGNGMSTTEKII